MTWCDYKVVKFVKQMTVWIKGASNHILCIHSVVWISLEVLFVEAHGRDDGACGPVDHHVCQEVIQAEFPVWMQTLFNKQTATIQSSLLNLSYNIFIYA